MRAIPPKDKSPVSPPALVDRDSGIVDALKAQSESIDALVDMVETNWLAQMAESSQVEDIESAEPAPSDEEGAGFDLGASFMDAACIVIALVVAVLLYGLYRFTHAPPAVAPTNGSKGEYIS
jgi:hypothetical protein